MSRPSRRELDQVRPAFISAKDRVHPAVAVAGVGLAVPRSTPPTLLGPGGSASETASDVWRNLSTTGSHHRRRRQGFELSPITSTLLSGSQHFPWSEALFHWHLPTKEDGDVQHPADPHQEHLHETRREQPSDSRPSGPGNWISCPDGAVRSTDLRYVSTRQRRPTASARMRRVVIPSPFRRSSAAKRPAKVRTPASMGPVTS